MIGDNMLAIVVLMVAFFYASVGHAGASGYIAVLTLAGWESDRIRPLALMLNIVVAVVATFRFRQAGLFRPAFFYPLTLAAVPFAAFGGYLEIPRRYLSIFIGIVLLLSAIWLITGRRELSVYNQVSIFVKVFVGSLIGFVAGLTGTGGGIFLSPLMIYLGWGKLKEIAAIAAPFIFFNSIAGLLGFTIAGGVMQNGWVTFVLMAIIGGFLGSTFGVRLVNPLIIQRILSFVLTVAGLKLLYTN